MNKGAERNLYAQVTVRFLAAAAAAALTTKTATAKMRWTTLKSDRERGNIAAGARGKREGKEMNDTKSRDRQRAQQITVYYSVYEFNRYK